jgi:hypothetical protein
MRRAGEVKLPSVLAIHQHTPSILAHRPPSEVNRAFNPIPLRYEIKSFEFAHFVVLSPSNEKVQTLISSDTSHRCNHWNAVSI